MVVSSSNNYFLFLSPNLTKRKRCINPIETSGFFSMTNSRFLVHWVKSRHGFRKSFLRFVLSFLINSSLIRLHITTLLSWQDN
jgi:hypothetical protein